MNALHTTIDRVRDQLINDVAAYIINTREPGEITNATIEDVLDSDMWSSPFEPDNTITSLVLTERDDDDTLQLVDAINAAIARMQEDVR